MGSGPAHKKKGETAFMNQPQRQPVQTIRLFAACDQTTEPMTVEESALFLLRRAKFISEQASQDEASLKEEEEYGEARTLAQECGGHPLALDLAGAYVEGTRSSLSAYLLRYRQLQTALLQERGQFSHNDDLPACVTLSLTCEHVEQINPSTKQLLRLFAFFHPENIPDEMFTQDADEQNKLL